MNKLFSSIFNWTSLAVVIFTAQLTNLAADSLWKPDLSRPIFSDKKAHLVGDILTILIQEDNGSTRENRTSTDKTSAVDASIASFLYGPTISGLLTKGGTYPALSAKGATSFDGGGKINNSETITAKLAVRVIDLLPNGNMVIEGRRETSFSGEKQEAILRGLVRADDVAANNTLYSYNIADATIQFIGKGTISDNQRKGWFTRVWEKLTPF